MNRIFLLLISNIIINITYANKEQTTFFSIAGNAIYTFIISLNPNYEKNKNRLYTKKKEHKEIEKNDGEHAFFTKDMEPDKRWKNYYNTYLAFTAATSYIEGDYLKAGINLYTILTGYGPCEIEAPKKIVYISKESDINSYLNSGYILVYKYKTRDEE